MSTKKLIGKPDALWLLIAVMVTAMSSQAIVPIPAGSQEQAIAITGVTIHTGNGDVIENGVITFAKGKITGVTAAGANINLKDHEVIEMQGRHLYPGFVLPNTAVGLIEVNSIRATQDLLERGELNPNVRSIIAYNTDSEIIPTLRFNGILTAQITPLGKLVGGFSSIVQLDGWNWEDAAYAVDDGIHLYWPALYIPRRDFINRVTKVEKNKDYDKLVESLPGLFENASVYDNSSMLNLKLGAIRKLLEGETRLYIHVDGSREIISAVRFAIRQGVKSIILVGGREALSVKDFLVEHDIPVILNQVHGLPDTEDGDVDQAFRRPAQLIAAGLKVGLAVNIREPAGARNLPFMAGTAAAYGLSKEAALTMITRTNAEIMGIADRLGTLETGKDATLFVSEGDALDMRGNRLLRAYIQGRLIDLTGTQQQLFLRYREKYADQSSP